MKGTSIPVYNYTFAEDEESAIHKVRMKFGEFDNDAFAREIKGEQLEKLVIGTNSYG